MLLCDILFYDFDGVIIVVDYGDVLVKFDCGDFDLLLVVSGVFGYGIGVVKLVIVVCDGKFKLYFVLVVGIVVVWILDDVDLCVLSLYLLIKMLVGIVYGMCYVDVLLFIFDVMGCELYFVVVYVFNGYWSVK